VLTGAIVGFGEVARHGHWPAYASSRDVRIAAIVDRTEARRRLAASLIDGVQAFATVDDLIASGTPLDFVDVCTPPALHGEPMLAAASRGWHVLCEKPFLLDHRMLEAARRVACERRVALVPVHNWKFAPIVCAATSALRRGDIGVLRRVRIETSRLREATTTDSVRPNWRRDPQLAGGGILMDHGWHAVYLALHWFGEPHTSVRCAVHRPDPDGVEDEAELIIGFPSGEAVIGLTWRGTVRRNAMTLCGDRGDVTIDDRMLHINGRREVFDPALSAGSHHPDWFEAMLPEVVACFRDPARARLGLDEAASCLSIIREAYQCGAPLAAPPR
jgi:predicted dehydrogenase